jgi:photosystem II stability/assembly factor-like uncharacterized protein
MWNDSPSELYGVFGSDPRNLYVVGSSGALLIGDGTTWQLLDSGLPQQNLHAVWAASAEDVFLAGSDSTIVHKNGAAWVPVQLSNREDLVGIFGLDRTNVWAVGQWGSIHRWDGAVWQKLRVAF